MQIKGDRHHYGTLAVALHWMSALAILALLVLGFTAARTSDPALLTALLRVHVPLGVMVLLLTATRIVWWFFDRRPEVPINQPHWQTVAARISHLAMYGILLATGVSGVGLLLLSGAVAPLFLGAPGPFPDFGSFAPMLVHSIGAMAIVVLLCLHVAAVAYHEFYRRDGLLARMGIRTTVIPRTSPRIG